MESLCRICRTTCESLVDIFLEQQKTDEPKPDLAFIIKECTGTLVIRGDPLPQKICPPCREWAISAFQFREVCQKSYEYFCQKLEKQDGSCSEMEHDIVIKEEYVTQEQEYFLIKEEPGNEAHEIQPNDYKANEVEDTEDLENEDAHWQPESGNEQNQLKCPHCPRAFKQKHKLIAHVNVHTGNRPYVCADCDKSFSCGDYLRRHRLIHTGEKKFPCSECSKVFQTGWNLKEHYRCVHTMERPFKCSHCPKSFKQTGARDAHERTHSGNRPFRCKDCSKAYTRNSDLRKHQLTHAN